MADYSEITKDELCGYTDATTGETVESPTDTVCDAWSDVCINAIP